MLCPHGQSSASCLPTFCPGQPSTHLFGGLCLGVSSILREFRTLRSADPRAPGGNAPDAGSSRPPSWFSEDTLNFVTFQFVVDRGSGGKGNKDRVTYQQVPCFQKCHGADGKSPGDPPAAWWPAAHVPLHLLLRGPWAPGAPAWECLCPAGLPAWGTPARVTSSTAARTSFLQGQIPAPPGPSQPPPAGRRRGPTASVLSSPRGSASSLAGLFHARTCVFCENQRRDFKAVSPPVGSRP